MPNPIQEMFLSSLRSQTFASTASEVAAQAYRLESGKSIKSVLADRETLSYLEAELTEAGLITPFGVRPCKITGDESTTYKLATTKEPTLF